MAINSQLDILALKSSGPPQSLLTEKFNILNFFFKLHRNEMILGNFCCISYVNTQKNHGHNLDMLKCQKIKSNTFMVKNDGHGK